MQIWLLSYDVAIRRSMSPLSLPSSCNNSLRPFIRKGKLLQALTFLTHAQTLNSSHPGLHLRLVHLHHFIRTTFQGQTPPAPIGPAFLEGVKQLGVPDENQVSLETYNQQYLQKHSVEETGSANPEAVLACAKAMRILGASTSEVEELLLGVLRFDKNGGLTVQLALGILNLLRAIGSERAEEFREGCKERFVRSTVFGTSEEIARLKEGVLVSADVGPKDEVL